MRRVRRGLPSWSAAADVHIPRRRPADSAGSAEFRRTQILSTGQAAKFTLNRFRRILTRTALEKAQCSKVLAYGADQPCLAGAALRSARSFESEAPRSRQSGRALVVEGASAQAT